jgi:RND family efflux transporter MFP subunit
MKTMQRLDRYAPRSQNCVLVVIRSAVPADGARRKILVGILAFMVAASGLSACGGNEQAPEVTQEEAIVVTVAPVAAADAHERLEAGGVVAAQESVLLSSRLVATILTVRVRPGDRVRAGDVLVTLDARDITEHTRQAQANALVAEKSLTQARTEQTAAEAEHRLATAWQTRIAALHARNSATDQERDEAEARLTSAAARLEGARAAIEVAEAHVAAARAGIDAATATESFTTLRAPFDGLVTERLIDPGNLAAPGVPLLRMDSDGARQVVVRVDEARVAYIHVGDRLRVLIETVEGPAAADRELEGVVAEVARAVGADQRTFAVKVALPRTVTARSGSFARIVFSGPPRRALLVPAHAVQRHGQVSTVFVVHDGVAHLRLVQTGISTSDGIEVLAGLDSGESVVTSPPATLRDGSRVTTGGAAVPRGAPR